jgi:hypothetical protein
MAASVYNQNSAYFEGAIYAAAFRAAEWALLMNDPRRNDNPKAVSRHFDEYYGYLAYAVDKAYSDSHQYQSNSDKLKDARLELFKSLRQMEDFLEYAEDALMQTFRINDLREGISDMLP